MNSKIVSACVTALALLSTSFPTAQLGGRIRSAVEPRIGLEGTLGYSVTDLGIASSVEAINDNGVAVGWLQPTPGVSFNIPLLWTNGSSRPLAELGPGGGQARDINNARQIAGWTPDQNFNSRPIRWDDGVPLDLGRLGTGTDGKGLALNQAGSVVGWASSSPGDLPQAFLADGTSMWLIGPPLPIPSEAHGINDRGEVVGFYVVPLAEERAFVHVRGALHDLGGLSGFRGAQARDINDSGAIVGYCTLPGLSCCEETVWTLDPWSPQRGFRRARDLNSPGVEVNRAHAVSERGHIVGDTLGRAFVWKDGLFRLADDLLSPGSGWSLLEARDVNCFGQVVGVGLLAGELHGYLLSPLPHLLVLDEVPEGAPITGTLAGPAGARFVVLQASSPGNHKVVLDGASIPMDLGPDWSVVEDATIDPSGRVDLSLSAPTRAQSVYWQALVELEGLWYRSNRMETRVLALE